MNSKLADNSAHSCVHSGDIQGRGHLPNNRPLVLAADDNLDNLLLLMYTLEAFGYSQITTLEGAMVLQLAEEYQPDLILLDVILPDLSGIEVIQQLKQNPLTSFIPIIAVTALARAEDCEYLMSLGCEGYLDKPYDLDTLKNMLQCRLNYSCAVQ